MIYDDTVSPVVLCVYFSWFIVVNIIGYYFHHTIGHSHYRFFIAIIILTRIALSSVCASLCIFYYKVERFSPFAQMCIFPIVTLPYSPFAPKGKLQTFIHKSRKPLGIGSESIQILFGRVMLVRCKNQSVRTYTLLQKK